MLSVMVCLRMFAQPAATSTPQLIRGPYIQSMSSNACIVAWRTDTPCFSKVEIKDQRGATRSFSNNRLSVDHAVVVSGLAPGDSFRYRFGATAVWLGDGPEYVLHTAPPEDEIRPVRIWALGDFGNGSQQQVLVKNSYLQYLNGARNDMWIWLGDNAYNYGTDVEYSNYVFNVYGDLFKSWNFYPAPGNHDYGMVGYQSAASLTTNFPYFDIFRLPTHAQAGGWPSRTEKYYSYDWSNIHFIALDSYGAYNYPGSPMYNWLEEDLRRNSKRWIIAYWHHPPYSKGSHDSDEEIEMVDMRRNIVPLLEKYGTDLVLTGHSHTYERSYYLHGHYGQESDFNTSMLVQTGDGHTTPYQKDSLNNGTVYIVCGVGGKNSPMFFPGYPHNAMAVSYTSVNGSSVIEINGDTLNYRFLRSDGIIADSFTMVKTWQRPADVIQTDQEAIQVYPVPSTGIFQIRYQLKEPAVLRIVNEAGEEILHDQVVTDKRVEINSGETGMYYFVFETGEDIVVKKVILQSQGK